MRSKLQEVRVDRRTPECWRTTFDNPPFNIFGPQTITQLSEMITRLEKDPWVKVVVFESAVPDFFLTHYDFVPPLSDTTDLAPGPTGLPDAKIGARWDGFISSVKRPQAQRDIKQLMELGLQNDPDVEKRLPVYTGKLGELSK
jgi:hypothetical protein